MHVCVCVCVCVCVEPSLKQEICTGKPEGSNSKQEIASSLNSPLPTQTPECDIPQENKYRKYTDTHEATYTTHTRTHTHKWCEHGFTVVLLWLKSCYSGFTHTDQPIFCSPRTRRHSSSFFCSRASITGAATCAGERVSVTVSGRPGLAGA
jgi:hypothetical protein